MITVMRRFRKSLQIGLLVVIAAFVASLFVFGATGSKFGGGEPRDSVATVNGEAIPIERFQRRYQSYVEAYAQIYRDRFSAELAERMGLPQQVLGDLVQEALIVQRATAEGLSVSDEELNARIHAIPLFQENGRFVLKRYQDTLKRRGYTPSAFESEIRREMTRAKVETAVRNGVKVSESELEQAFRLRREEVRAAWALVEVAPLVAGANATDEELSTYLTQHPDEFRQPDRRRVQYVTLTPKDFAASVTDADVEKFYKEHQSEYETPRQVRASHVLVRVPETGGSEGEDKARAKIADVIRRAKAGADFGKLAQEVSEDPATAPRGGDLGLVGKGEMVPQFEQPLFALKKGEISPEPVRTPFGFHAIKVVDIQEASKKPVKEVAPQIKSRLSAEVGERGAKAKAEELRGPLQAAKDFMAEAKKLGLSPIETTMAKIERASGMAAPDPLEDAAFSLSVGGVSSPIVTPVGVVILKTTEVIPAGVPPLAEIRDKVAAAVKRQKAETVALERAKQIAADAQAGDFAAAAKKAGAVTGETARFSRSKPAEKLPGDAMLAALSTRAGQLSAPVKAQQGVYVVKVLERVPPDMGGLAAERDKIHKEVLVQKQSLAWESWINGARANSKVETHLPASRRG
ncbi:MAG TPA: SurA N-terminal domain-containing protein [Methylomirabilota bacterium]|nr:SurA N-terminal domain-containing protein [Methylomirabilota bacterium]